MSSTSTGFFRGLSASTTAGAGRSTVPLAELLLDDLLDHPPEQAVLRAGRRGHPVDYACPSDSNLATEAKSFLVLGPLSPGGNPKRNTLTSHSHRWVRLHACFAPFDYYSLCSSDACYVR